MRRIMLARRITLALLAALPLSLAGAAAQDFPSRPATWIVPYPPGGGADTISRLVTAEIAKRLGQPVVNENKPGASTQIGLKAVAEARPDGHTIGMMTADINVTSALLPSAPFDLERDFAYITQIIDVPMVMVANSKAPFTNLKELVAYAKANPDKITAASIGATSIHHVGMEWFKKLAGLDFLVVPYRGTGPGLQGLLANEVQLMFMGVGVGDEFVANGTLRNIAVGSATRIAKAPNVPTFVEEGYPTFDLVSWYGMVAPPRTPAAALSRWSKEIHAALADPEIHRRVEATGAVIRVGTETELAALVRSETQKYKEVARLTGLKAPQ
jgi:tripartite-type tricarboxylate transporter receptor subunit TctC